MLTISDSGELSIDQRKLPPGVRKLKKCRITSGNKKIILIHERTKKRRNFPSLFLFGLIRFEKNNDAPPLFLRKKLIGLFIERIVRVRFKPGVILLEGWIPCDFRQSMQ